MIIVSGRMKIKAGNRQGFLAASLDAIQAARKTGGCRDFIVAADPIEDDRVNIYEEWDSEHALLAFRGEGPDAGMTNLIIDAQVRRHAVSSSGPA